MRDINATNSTTAQGRGHAVATVRTPVGTRWVVLADVASIVLFAAIGRRSHAESSAVVGVLITAWPFLVGAAAGWLIVRVMGRPAAAPSSGLIIVAATVPVAMMLRWLTDRSVAWSFVVVATLVLSVLLVGWRLGWRWWSARH